ncbi:gamma-glutamyl-gamma-aminobutyrate hydrolase family protein [Carboxylicivirga sp. M1479]|uniref:gamma-glutamyl-gamma-aminobutyrate hydrolase family protein n=1 Tax=Carboxylicivirga sp. M1479 TaxID=2594476 RepID=UPI001178920C|nr:gamma-glutamyl-gamma-aminobutyrate hydrolase family protein [Carboxylicivirga sp. M1479]TRX61905.1 gamma-glutamyl-gamma-aminobutyrate hydrolase family protein [Carboxylicivirga sp. M1479]
MRHITLLLLLCSLSIQAQLFEPLPTNINKRVIIAHPTASNIEVLDALYQKKLLDLSSIQLIGLYHRDEKYDYSKSQSMLDTLRHLNMSLLELKDTLHMDSLFCSNASSATFKQLFNESEGIVFLGGPDIPPALYGEETHPRTKVTDPYRHYYEASFLYHLLGGYQNTEYTPLLEENPEYLVFGICLGMQTMNIASGGTLIQDIPLEVFNNDETLGLQQLANEEIHRNYYPKMPAHENDTLAGSHFHTILFKDYFFPALAQVDSDSKPLVNSYHHQAIEKLGKGLVVGATSSDGKIIEAVFHAHYPNVFGVQFHPERSQFYIQTRQSKFTPDGEAIQLSDCLDDESMSFHLQFWKAVNHLIQEL